MRITVKNFFSPTPPRPSSSEEESDAIGAFVKFAEAISQTTHPSYYLIDYYKQGFIYVSDNPLFLCGKTAIQILNEGFLYYFKNVPEEELKIVLKCSEAGFEFYQHILPENRLDYSISFDFHLLHPGNKRILVNHRFIPLLLDQQAHIRIALCVVDLSPNNAPGNLVAREKSSDRLFEYNPAGSRWVEKALPKLADREREILILSNQGLTMDQMAERLFLSVDTIKFHRKNIFKKLNVQSITEALSAAIALKII